MRIYTDTKTITCKFVYTNRLIIWRLILEDFGQDIEYIKCNKNIVDEALSRLPLNVNQDITEEVIYQKGIVS